MQEKLKILDLLENKEITAEEAEKRLEALRNAKTLKERGKFRTFKIMISSAQGDLVNVQVPMNLARVLLKGKNHFFHNSTFNNVDIDIDEVIDMLDSGAIGELVNIESADGDTVKIFVE